jgi:hypothetical protein
MAYLSNDLSQLLVTGFHLMKTIYPCLWSFWRRGEHATGNECHVYVITVKGKMLSKSARNVHHVTAVVSLDIDKHLCHNIGSTQFDFQEARTRSSSEVNPSSFFLLVRRFRLPHSSIVSFYRKKQTVFFRFRNPVCSKPPSNTSQYCGHTVSS